MNSSRTSQNNYSPGIKYANVITTISLALFLMLWGMIWANLRDLNDRMRHVELDLNTIKAVYGITAENPQNDKLSQSLSGQGGRLTPPGLEFSP